MTAATPRGAVILGHPRSGTTLLRRLLNAHPEIASPPETHVLSACARFLGADHTAEGVDMGVLAGLHFAGFDEEDVLRELREFAFGFFDRFAQREGKSRWVEKTAFDIFFLDEIEGLCGDEVYYVGIVRHPLDVAVSTQRFCEAAGVYPAPIHDFIKRYPQPIEAFVRSWIATTAALMDLGRRRPDRCMICRYEDLVAEPDETLTDVLSFMGVEHPPGFGEGALVDDRVLGFSDHKSYQESAVHTKSVDAWRSLPGPQVARLAPLLEPFLAQCGYDALDAGEPITPQEARKRYAKGLAVHAIRRGAGGGSA